MTCDDEGARSVTPTVRAQRNGLHVQVKNDTARPVHFTLERDSHGGAGAEAQPGASEHVFALGPGTWTVTCYVAGADTTAAAPTFELVDTGIWISTDLTDCEYPESLHGDPPRRITSNTDGLAAHARRGLEGLVELEPRDVVEPAGYPLQEETIFRARRDGRTVATISFFPEGAGAWLEGEVTACSDLG